jgi:hypothetical protein
MGWNRIASTAAGGVVLDDGAVKVEIAAAALGTHDTPAKLLAEAERQAGKALSGVFFHVNRDGSVAIATGQEPDAWPEDTEPDSQSPGGKG